MKHQIKSSGITVETTTAGGQFTSIRDNGGIEYLWQPDPKYWNNQSPICFPIVGSLRNKTATIGGDRTCTMERHGVVKPVEFTQTDAGGDFVVLSFRANEATKTQYPFDFELQVKYSVSGKTLTTGFTVINHDSVSLPYQIGGHPAFNCPMGGDGKFEDYVVQFEHRETADCPTPVPETGLCDLSRRTRMLDDSETLKMSHDLFKVDAVIFDRLKSRKAKLCNPNSGRGIEVSFADFHNLLIWSTRNGAPFVAVEPWSGMTTCNNESDIFEEKSGVFILEPGKSKTHSYQITIL